MVSICHSVARETRPRCLGPPRASLSFALSPFFLALSTPGSASSSFSHVESIFEFGGRAAPHGRWLDITRILKHLRTFLEFDPRIPEVAPKIPRLPPIPFLSARTPVHTRAIPIGIREIRSINNRESDKKFNVEPIKLFYIKYNG